MANMVLASMDDALTKILSDISQMFTVRDADPDFLKQLQDIIVQHLQQRAEQKVAAVSPGNPQMQGGGGGGQSPPPMPQGMNPGGVPMQIGPGGGAGMSGLGMPNPDELRRILQTDGAG